jgi:hypothetical protein
VFGSLNRTVAVLTILAFSLGCHRPSSPSASPEEVLRVQCQRYAANPAIPWALAHGIVAFGKDFRATDGRLAIDVMVDDYLLVESAGAVTHYGFAEFDGQRPIEPHLNLIVKTMLVAGVPLTRTFRTRDGHQVTLKQLLDDIEARFVYEPGTGEFWSRMSWTIDAIGTQLTPARATFVNGQGQTIDWNDVIDAGFTDLENIDASFEEAMAQGRPFVEKRKQGIYAHTCGGFHFIQPLMLWLRHPDARHGLKPRFDAQMKVLLYRLQSERQVYDHAIEQAPQYKLVILVQELKFYGHWLETMGRLIEAGVLKPDTDQLEQIASARASVARTVEGLQQKKAFTSMEEIEKSGYQTYLDLIGDSCHAYNGWRLTTPPSPRG